MSNKETLQSYNNRLSINNISLNDILDRINNLPSGSGSSSEQCAPNIFIQPNEPEKFEGIWINSDNDSILNEVAITTEITQKDSVLNWTKTMLTPLPNPFYNGRCVSIGTDIYIFGGGGNNANSESRFLAYKYDTLTNTYIQLANIPYSYYDGVIGASGTNIYLFGGISNERKAYKYDTLTNEYTQLTDLPFNSVNGYSASVGTDVYIFTSYNATQTAYKYNTLNDTYQQIANTPTPTAYGKATSIDTNIYIFGSNNNRQTAYKYDTLTNTYVRIHDIPFGFFNGGCVNDGTYIYLLGTEVTGVKKYVYKYDPSNNTYSQLTSLPNDFWNGDATSIDHKLYVLGGSNTPNDILVASTVELDTNVNITDGLVIYSPVGDKHLYNTELFSSDNINNRVLFGFNALLHVSPAGTNIVKNDSYYGTGSQWLKCSDMKLTPNTSKEKILQDKDVTILKNGTQTIVPDIGFDGLTSVHVTTSVPMTGETITKGVVISGRNEAGEISELSAIGYTEDLVNMNNLTSDIFNKCTKIILDDSVSRLPARCFENDKYIEEIVISNPVACDYGGWTTYGPGATFTFNNCTALKKIDGTKLLEVHPQMFQDCTSLVELELNENITSIPPRFFNNCTSLAWTKLPSSVKLLGNKISYYSPSGYVFNNCKSLALTEINDDVEVGANNGSCDHMFYGCENLALTKIPSSWTFIAQHMFYNCYNLKLSDLTHVTNIGQYGFYNCKSLEEITLGVGLKELGGYAFANCIGLKKITIRGTFTTLSYYCFQNCTSLEEVDMETSGTSLTIQNYVFDNCASLKKFRAPTLTLLNQNAVFKNTGLVSLCLPAIKEIGTTASSTSYDLFGTTTPLKAIWLGSDVTKINRYTFRGCASLLKIFINLPRATVEAMANYSYAFMNDGSKQNLIVCNDDAGFMTQEQFEATDWDSYTE